MSSAKEELIKVIEGQSDDSTLEEVVRELTFYLMIRRGLADADAGRVIPDDEMARRIQAWAK